MRETWKRIKEWLIKKLGGYTKAEYDALAGCVRTRYEFLPPQRMDVHVIRAEGEYAFPYAPPAEYMKDKLLVEIAKQAEPYVNWETSESYLDFLDHKKTIRASLRVLSYTDD